MIFNCIGLVFVLLARFSSVAYGGSLKARLSNEPLAARNDATATAHTKPMANEETLRRQLAENLNKIDQMTKDYVLRKLQQLPPPFVPTRACGETIGVVTKAEISALSNVFITALFAESGDTGLADLAISTLLGQIKYDLRLVKVCMTCTEAAALLPADVVASSDGPFDFQNFCGNGMYGVGEMESGIAFIPVDPDTGDIVAGSMRGHVYGRQVTIPLQESPSELVPADWTQYIADTEVNDILVLQRGTLVPAIFSGSGATAIYPDFLGYGESYQVDRPFLAKQFYARSYALTWLATREYIRCSTAGSSDLEAFATVSGFSEGGYSTIPGALGLKAIGVTIGAAYPGGAPFQPSRQVGFTFGLFADSAPPLEPRTVLFQQLLGTYFAYSFSNEFPFLANTGSDQYALADNWRQGNITNNVLLWFQSPAQIGFGFVNFFPSDPLGFANPDLLAIYDEARLFGSDNACEDFVSADTDKLCQAIAEASLISELTNLVDFPTVVCQSPEDDLVAPQNAPDFPFANPLVTQYTGIPVLNILEPQGNHAVSYLICAISPILSLQVQGDNSPARITPLQNSASIPAGCPLASVPTASPSAAPSKVAGGSPTTEAPSGNSPTDAPSGGTMTTAKWAFVTWGILAAILTLVSH